MKLPAWQGRTWRLIGALLPLLLLFIYVVIRSGPLTPVAVTVLQVPEASISPALFGLGQVEARQTYKIGPTFAGRVLSVQVQVGDTVTAGQLLGEMDAVDLADKLQAQQAALRAAQAQLEQAVAKQDFAQTQAARYERLLAVGALTQEALVIKKQELAIARASAAAAQEGASRVRAELAALRAQGQSLKLFSPVAGMVVARDADPGTTVLAGQAVVEVIDPDSLWVNAKFEQSNAQGLAAGLPVRMVLRSRRSQVLAGQVQRIEPRADAVTEEILAKIAFITVPKPMPALGELTEVSVDLAALPAQPVIPNAAIRNVGGQRGVWKLVDGRLQFAPVVLGGANLEGQIQVLKGLQAGEQIVVYSEKALDAHSRIRVRSSLQGGGS